MAEYTTLEKATYDGIISNPFTRILGKPTWHQKEKLIEEASDLALDMDVSYPWSGSWGLLAVIQGGDKYLADTALEYIEPTKPPHQNALLTNANQGAARVRVLTEANNLLKRDYAVFKGFAEGVCYNFRAAMDATYYQQLYRPIFKFKGLTPRQYIVELETKWVFLDERQIKSMKDNYFRGWNLLEEHITKFAIRLDLEQADLQRSDIKIDDVDKNLHYMLMMWDSDLFSEPTMTEWMSKPPAERTYEHSVPFFETKVEALEKYEAGSGGRRKNPFSTAAAATEIQSQLEGFVTAISSKDDERALAARETKSEVAELKEQIQLLTSMVRDLAAAVEARPAKRPRRQVEYASESETEASEVEEVRETRKPPP
jgi:hypothetical protein